MCIVLAFSGFITWPACLSMDFCLSTAVWKSRWLATLCVCVCVSVCVHACLCGCVFLCTFILMGTDCTLKAEKRAPNSGHRSQFFFLKRLGFFFSELGPRVKFRLFTACSVFQNIFSNTFLDLILSDWPVLPVDVCFSRHKDVQVRRIKLHTLNK